MVQLMLLKSTGQTSSEFVETENIQMFESIWQKLSYQQMIGEYGQISVEHIRMFFLNMHYVWGEWLRREKLL